MNFERGKKAAGVSVGTAKRLGSLDVFRGLVIVVMTLVNYLSPVQGVPAWAKHHAPETGDGYTFVDVVFPAFLFMVGLAIPFALGRRLERGDSAWALTSKIAVRSAALLLLGVLTVNDHYFASDLVPLGKSLWCFLALVCAVTLCLGGPAQEAGGAPRWQVGLKVAAAVGLVTLLCLFRGRDQAQQVTWLQHSYWGMLGMIGWSYLVSSLVWLVLRDHSTALMGTTAFMLALYVGSRHGRLDWLGPVQGFVNVGINCGSNPATVMMGVLVAHCLRKRELTDGERLKFMLWFGAGLYAAGMLVRPLHGINKSAHTEAYALVAGGICCVVFAAVYWVVDVRQVRRGTGFLVPLGQNALLAYLLPMLLAHLAGVFGRSVYWWQSGWAGAGWAAGLTVMILGATWSLTRWGVRLRL